METHTNTNNTNSNNNNTTPATRTKLKKLKNVNNAQLCVMESVLIGLRNLYLHSTCDIFSSSSIGILKGMFYLFSFYFYFYFNYLFIYFTKMYVNSRSGSNFARRWIRHSGRNRRRHANEHPTFPKWIYWPTRDGVCATLACIRSGGAYGKRRHRSTTGSPHPFTDVSRTKRKGEGHIQFDRITKRIRAYS